MHQAYLLIGLLVFMITMFIWGRWRYDVVAFLSLVIAVLLGLVPTTQAFSGFNHPAVITVACIMMITGAISASGTLDYLVSKIDTLFSSMLAHIVVLTLISGFMSAFMNNVGALGLMMPIAIQTFIKNKRSPSIILIPIAFGSVLGGLTTAIGTPPNLIISQYRKEITGQAFSMFDYTPVGLAVALVGIFFIVLIGWRFIPERRNTEKTGDLFKIYDYMTEVKVVEKSPFIDKTIDEIFEMIDADFGIVAIERKGSKKFSFDETEVIHENDTLILEATHDSLEKIISKGKLEIATDKSISSKALSSSQTRVMEAVVPPDSDLAGRSVKSLRLKARFGINLIALSRTELSFRKKLKEIKLQSGDVVLLQGDHETLRENIVYLGFLPLATRDINIGLTQKSVFPLLFLALGIIVAAMGYLPIAFSLAMAVLAIILSRVTSTLIMFRSIDWSVLLLLAAVIPIGGAIQTTGSADLIANLIMQYASKYSPVIALVAVLIITMTLSDLMNNAATAIVMAPIATQIAHASSSNVDAFLMAVAIGASCSFLTPIAHQNNTMVMGPGGYKFFDYARIGLPLELIIIAVATPAILWIWPL